MEKTLRRAIIFMGMVVVALPLSAQIGCNFD
jgi:hypothetical protein